MTDLLLLANSAALLLLLAVVFWLLRKIQKIETMLAGVIDDYALLNERVDSMGSTKKSRRKVAAPPLGRVMNPFPFGTGGLA